MSPAFLVRSAADDEDAAGTGAGAAAHRDDLRSGGDVERGRPVADAPVIRGDGEQRRVRRAADRRAVTLEEARGRGGPAVGQDGPGGDQRVRGGLLVRLELGVIRALL